MNDVIKRLEALSDSAKCILLKEYTYDTFSAFKAFLTKTPSIPPPETTLTFEDLLLDEKFLKWYVAYETTLPQLIQDQEKGIFHSLMFYCIEGVKPLVGPLNQRDMFFRWRVIDENGKVINCMGPICENCTCGYK